MRATGTFLRKEEIMKTETKRPSALSYANSGLFMVCLSVAAHGYFDSSTMLWLFLGGASMFFTSALCKSMKNLKEGKEPYE